MKLYTTGRALKPFSEPVIARVTTRPISAEERHDYCVLIKKPSFCEFQDFSHYAGLVSAGSIEELGIDLKFLHFPVITSTPHLDLLEDGDVISLDPSGFIRILYRKKSPSNSILLTERCNSLCLMCSQPPKDTDDSNRIREHLRLIDLIDVRFHFRNPPDFKEGDH